MLPVLLHKLVDQLSESSENVRVNESQPFRFCVAVGSDCISLDCVCLDCDVVSVNNRSYWHVVGIDCKCVYVFRGQLLCY